ncbi:Peptidase, M6-like [Desulfonema limicola]|uniref:Peptidase, M6-like n=1 Tax=Desulfonema limicola TaxID=45656 RepID=A0A975B8B4_9BACT|nr:M6 family metalloprotease domain-containing protein [Desulfonema limicola]QTA80688.1 Peptidase, M6-like [Desulfonema limicola]
MSVIFGEKRTFPQGEGPDVQLKVFGDEFYARYENINGYTVVYDPDIEKYCYASLIDGRLVSSSIPISRRPPDGLRRHLHEDKNIRNQKFKQRFNEHYPHIPSVPGIAGAKRIDNALLPGKKLTRGKITGLTIIVNFKDIKTDINNKTLEAMLNHDNFQTGRNKCSVREYFLTISGNTLDYSNIVAGPVTLSQNQAYYINHSFVNEAIEKALSGSIDISLFDSCNQGIVDAVNFLYAGRSLYKGRLWPHNKLFDTATGDCPEYKGYKFSRYMTAGLGRKPVDMSIGTICHETGHLLCRFPDLYDYGTCSSDTGPGFGLGSYCLMASGSRLDYGRNPAPVCIYLRDLAGWTKKEILLNQPGQYQIVHGDYKSVFRYEIDEKPNEYFLVENRSRMELDSHLPASGLAVYHCDTLGSNEWPQSSPDRHYQCSLLQADGYFSLENNLNSGDRFDLFDQSSGVVLSYDTIPSTRAWDGTDSGLNILDISGSGETISFKTGNAGEQGENRISNTPMIFREVKPDLLIPDDDPNGLFSFITIDISGKVKDILITLDISHAFIGDLEVTLRTPSGDKILLHNRDWGNDDDLNKVYDIDSVLSVLKDKQIQGEWILCIKDLTAQDTGRLNGWSLMIEYEPADRIIQTEAVSGLRIPDGDWKGISSAIPIEQEGLAKGIKVYAEITHPYIGDIQLTLFTPYGQSIILMPFGQGRNIVNLRRSYDSETHQGLRTLIKSGQQMLGDWILQVIDSEPGNAGILERWSLALIC